MHLKCHVCEQGATNKHWQGYIVRHRSVWCLHGAQGRKLTAMLFRQIEQSWVYDCVAEALPELAVMFRNLLCVVILYVPVD